VQFIKRIRGGFKVVNNRRGKEANRMAKATLYNLEISILIRKRIHLSQNTKM